MSRAGREGAPSPSGADALGPRYVPLVSVVIPALNEAKNLERLLPALPDGLHEVVLVDGKSVDGTIEVACRLRSDIRVIRQNRSGKGNALACGFAACSGDIIVMLDADCSADPNEIPRFVDALLDGADFAKGSRFLDGGGSHDITRLRAFGNRCLSSLVNVLFDVSYSDLCYGYNAFWARCCLPVLDLDWRSPPPEDGDGQLWGDGFEIETLINIRIAAAGLKVMEVPSYERARIFGVSNLNAARDGMRVLRTILSERRRTRALAERGRRPGRLIPVSSAAEKPPLAVQMPRSRPHLVERRVGGRRKQQLPVVFECRSGADRRQSRAA